MINKQTITLLLLLISVSDLGCTSETKYTDQEIEHTVNVLLDYHRNQIKKTQESQNDLQLRAELIKMESGLEWANNFSVTIEPEILLTEKTEIYLRLSDLGKKLGNQKRSQHYIGKASKLCKGWDLGDVCSDERI